MQRLRDITEEVDQELESFFSVRGSKAPVVDALSVVRYGGDDAAAGAGGAVAGEGDGAG